MRLPDNDSQDKFDRISNFVNDVLSTQHESSISKYLANYRRLDGEPWHQYAEAKNLRKNSAQVYRAAERYFGALQLRSGLEEFEYLAESGQFTDSRLLLNDLVTFLDLIKERLGVRYNTSSRKKRTKRKSITGKPETWPNQVVRNMTAGSNQLGALLMSETGCRPAELRKGVRLEVHDENLKITIKGAKVSNITKGGQPERSILLDGSFHGPKALLHWLRKKGRNKLIFELNSYNSLYYAVKKSAESLQWNELSPYSFRQQLASNLKSQGNNDEFLSQILGHRSSRSKSAYGHANQGWYRGRGRSAILAVETTYPVRVYEVPEPSPGPSLG